MKTCQTCLYMATHEKCDNCLTEPGDYDNFDAEHGFKRPEYKYLHWKEGNWFARVMLFELEGKRNIVIGGQGEAEVNTKWTPQKTSKHLHYVSEQCGYMTGNLSTNKAGDKTLMITTTEGVFKLVWDSIGLHRIEKWNYDYDWDTNTDNSKYLGNQWNRDDVINAVEAMANDKDPVISDFAA